MKKIVNPQFQGVITTPIVGLIQLVTVKLILGGVILTPKRSLQNSFSGVKVTPDIEELNNPIFGVISTPDWD